MQTDSQQSTEARQEMIRLTLSLMLIVLPPNTERTAATTTSPVAAVRKREWFEVGETEVELDN